MITQIRLPFSFSRRGYPIILFLLVFLHLGSPARAAENAAGTPVVSLKSASEVSYPPFCDINEKGEAEGFSIELMKAALQDMNREVEFRTGPWNEVMTWLKNGEVEALPLVARTPEREPLFDFSLPYLTLHGSIVVREDTTDIRTLGDLKGRTVEVMKGDNIEEYLRREDRGIDIITTPTFEIALRDLDEGRCDAVVILRLVALRLIREAGLNGLKIINQPLEGFQQDFCFAVRKGNRATLSLLNEGLSLVIADGTFTKLHAKWFSSLDLPSNRRIVVGGVDNYPPYEYLDEDGKPAGYLVDLTKAIAIEMGLNLELRLQPWSDAVQALEQGNIDALEGMTFSRERDRKFDFSPPHTINYCVGVIRRGEGRPPSSLADLAGKDIVVERGDIMDEFTRENGIETFLADSQASALRELSEGRYDCALVSRITALYWIPRSGWDNLEVGKESLLESQYCYAVLNGNKPLLAQFAEGLKVLEENGEYQRIYNKWMGIYDDRTPGLSDILWYVALVAIPLLLILLISFLWSWSLRKQVAVRTEDLRALSERHQAILDEIPEIVMEVDLDRNYTWGNPAGIDFFGEGVVGSNAADYAENGSDLRDQTAPLFTGETEKLYLENRQRRKDGEMRLLAWWCKPLRDSLGRITGALSSARDITEQKQIDEALYESEKRLISAQQIARMGDFTWDVETGEVNWSDALFDLLKYDKSEDIDYSRVNIEIHHPDDLERITRWLNDCIESGRDELTPNEYRIIDRNGDVLHVRTVGIIKHREGRKPVIFATIQDITILKKAHFRIEHLNRVLRAIRNVNQLIVREKDPEMLIQEGCRLLVENRGYLSAMIILTDDQDRPRSWAEAGMGAAFLHILENLRQGILPACCRQAVQEEGVLVINDRAGLCRDCPISGHYPDSPSMCIHLASEERNHGCLVVALEENLVVDEEETSLFQEMADDLAFALSVMELDTEHQESKQKAARLEDQLFQAQKLESIGRLAGGVAHDYNNMLSVIIGYSELALDRIGPDDSLHEDLTEILNAARRSAEITRQLLAFARRQTISPRLLDLNQTLEKMLQMLRKLIGEDIELTWLPGASLWPVRMDPVQISQILANLCVNSRDAIEGVGRITIETSKVSFDQEYCNQHSGFLPGEYVLLAVSDTGCGIDRDMLANIFEPFYTTKDDLKGTGLGLAMVYGIVRQNEGFINVYSEPGKGTTFRIYLPRHQGDIEKETEEAAGSSPRGKGETLLLVEDEPEIMKMTRAMLEKLGYVVLSTTSPGEAIRLAEEHAAEIQLLLTDLIMPGMNGKDLSSGLAETCPELKTLFMSGYTANVIAHHGVLDQGVNFIQKPFSMKELAAKISRILEHGKDAP